MLCVVCRATRDAVDGGGPGNATYTAKNLETLARKILQRKYVCRSSTA